MRVISGAVAIAVVLLSGCSPGARIEPAASETVMARGNLQDAFDQTRDSSCEKECKDTEMVASWTYLQTYLDDQSITVAEACQNLSTLEIYLRDYDPSTRLEYFDLVSPILADATSSRINVCANLRTSTSAVAADVNVKLPDDDQVLNNARKSAGIERPEFKTATFQCVGDFALCQNYFDDVSGAFDANFGCGVAYLICVGNQLIPFVKK